MPQARSSRGTKAGSSSRSTRSGTARSSKSGTASARPAGGRGRGRSGSAGGRATGAGGRAAGAGGGSADARLDAAARRLRTLNERIIEAGKEAGASTLSSYERVLKSIASTIERGPGSSDVEWVSNLATAQAKFIRDLATTWTAAARRVLR
jgi:hypothetical protein